MSNKKYAIKPLDLLSIEERDELSNPNVIDPVNEVASDDLVPILDVSSSRNNRTKKIRAGQLVADIAGDTFADKEFSNIDDYQAARDNLGLGDLAIEDQVSSAIKDNDAANVNARLGEFATVADVQNSHIPAVLESIEVSGYRYNSVSSEPSHPGKVQDASGRWFELAEAVARPQMFGARGDGATDDQSALEVAVNFALLTGAEIYWPNGAYVSTGNIPNFHSVSHTGPGVLVRGSDTYHVQPKVLDNNTLYVSPSGTGDGLSSSHPMSAAAARTALMNYGPFIDGVWVIRFAAGVYEGVTLTFNQRFQSRWPLVLEGPDVGGHPNEPTAVFDGTGESDWFCRASDGVRIRVNNIKVINYTQSGAFTSTRARMALVNVHMDNVIHGVSSIHQSNISVSGGVWTGMGKEVFGDGLKTLYGSSFGVSGHNSPSDGTIIQNFQRGVAGLDAASSGHIDYITVQNCGTGLFFNRGGGANCTGVRVWNNDLGLYAGSGTFSLLTSSADFGVGTPNANAVKQRIEAGAIDWSRLSGSLSESQIASATIPAHTGTTSETVLWTPWTIRAGDVSEGRGDTLRLNAWGSGPALAEDAMLRLSLSGDTVISISIPAGSTTWEVEFIVRFTSGSGQRNLVKRFSGASSGINYITSSVDMQVDRDVELSCTLGDASDSVTLRTVTLYATMYGG